MGAAQASQPQRYVTAVPVRHGGFQWHGVLIELMPGRPIILVPEQVALMESLDIPFQRLVEIEPAGDGCFRWQGDTVHLRRGERATLTDDQVAYIEALGLAIERVR